MKNVIKYQKALWAAILFLVGCCSVVFGKSLAIQGGISCACWGVAVFIMSVIGLSRNQKVVDSFDIEAREILRDIAQNGVDSDYYMHYDIEKLNRIKYKLLKRQRKQIFSFWATGTIFIIIAILCFF